MIEWANALDFTVGGVAFRALPEPGAASTTDEPGPSLVVHKSATMVRDLVEVMDAHRHGNVVELGIFAGGSVAFTAMMAQPRRLVAIEKGEPINPSLATFIEAQQLAPVVTTHYGVDQSDVGRLRAILSDAFGDEPLDLVIDDASHQYWQTRASLEVLLPRLRPGGTFLIEDWMSDQRFLSYMTKLRNGSIDPRERNYVVSVCARIGASFDDVDDSLHPFARYLVETGWGDVIGVDADRAADPPRNDRAVPAFVPMTRLIQELVLLRAAEDDVLRSVGLFHNWVIVERGAEPLDAASFDLDDLVDPFASLSER